MKVLKETFALMKKDPTGCANAALIWIATLAATVLLSVALRVELLPILYVIIVMPSIISIRFIFLSYSTGKRISYKSYKIGYVTFQSSVKLYFRMIVDALVTFISMMVAAAVIYIIAFRYAEPSTYDKFIQTTDFVEMFKLITSPTWFNEFFIVAFIVSAIVYYLVKFRSNFLPFIAFQAPIDARSAKKMSALMLKGNYLHYSLVNLSSLLFLVPIGLLGYGAYHYMYYVQIATAYSSLLVAVLLCSLLLVPVVSFYGIYNAVYYNSHSAPFQKEINGALEKLLRELRELEDVASRDDDK